MNKTEVIIEGIKQEISRGSILNTNQYTKQYIYLGKLSGVFYDNGAYCAEYQSKVGNDIYANIDIFKGQINVYTASGIDLSGLQPIPLGSKEELEKKIKFNKKPSQGYSGVIKVIGIGGNCLPTKVIQYTSGRYEIVGLNFIIE